LNQFVAEHCWHCYWWCNCK